MSSAVASQSIWRVPSSIRRSAVTAGFLFVLVALFATAIGLNAVSAVFLWLLAVLMLVCAWRWYLVPYVALTRERLVVQGAIARHSVRYSAIREVRPGLYGLRIRTANEGSFIGWAVQKSKFAEWSHRDTTADEVVAEIMERVHDSTPSTAPTA